MAKRLYVYVSKSDTTQTLARIADQLGARADANAYLGIDNWVECDATASMLPLLGGLVNLARERAQTPDGTGRWKWRTIANAVRAWLGEPTDETCASCGNRIV